MKRILWFMALVAALVIGAPKAEAQNGNAPSVLSIVAGRHVAKNYATWRTKIYLANGGSIASGTGVSIPLFDAGVKLADGRTIMPWYPNVRVLLGVGSVAEVDTITSTSGCYLNAPPGSCTIVVTTTNAHGNGETVTTGSVGVDEAILDAASGDTGVPNPSGTFGGVVVLDPSWTAAGGTNVTLNGIVLVLPNVAIEDDRSYAVQYWTLQGGATPITIPATLTSGTSTSGTSPAGTFANSAYTVGYTCVDIQGQESQGAVGLSITPAAGSSSITILSPAAKAGCVGYVPYSTLAGASYPVAYKIPLVTQPTVVGATPVSNGVCTLTALEVVTPACAWTNATYVQTGSAAVLTAIPVNTSPIIPQLGIVSTTSVFVPNPGARTTYTYAPGSHLGTPGLPVAELAFNAAGSAASTVPTVLGTVNIPPNFMNFIGRTIEICGKSGIASGSTTTIETISFQWDSMGQNSAGKGVVIGTLGLTPGTAFASAEADTFCEDFQTTVAAATATGGSINTIGGFIATSGASTAAAGQGAGSDPTLGATGSLNLADDARINVVYLHTTGTFAPTLQALSVKVLN